MTKFNNNKVHSTPINSEAEQAMLGCILMDVNVANDYTTLLNENDFAMSQNKVIFRSIFELNNTSKPIDILTVSDKLAINNEMEKAGGMEYLSKLITSIPSTVNASQYYDILKRDSLLREIIEAGNKIAKNAYTAKKGMEALDYAERTVFEISEQHELSRLLPIVDATSKVYNKIKSIQRGEYKDEGVYSGFANLDDVIGNMKPGALCMLAARPSVGKTAFSLSIAINSAIKYGKSVAIFSLEMPTEQLVQRMMTTLSGVPFSSQMTRNKLDMNDTAKLFRAHEALCMSKIYVDDNPNNKPSDIISKCRRMKNTEGVGLDLVIIDYLQLMTLDETTRVESRQQEVSNMSRLMKIYAKELGVPFLVLSQMSRAAEQRGDEPMLSDLRESGSIEQDADIVMFLHRPKIKENAKSKESLFIQNYNGSILKLLVLKNRNGKIGNTFFDWKGDYQKFTPVDIKDREDYVAPTKSQTETEPMPISKTMGDDPMADLKFVSEINEDNAKNVNKNNVGNNNTKNGENLAETADKKSKNVEVANKTIQEAPFDTSNDYDYILTNNESGNQAFDSLKDDGDLDY